MSSLVAYARLNRHQFTLARWEEVLTDYEPNPFEELLADVAGSVAYEVWRILDEKFKLKKVKG